MKKLQKKAIISIMFLLSIILDIVGLYYVFLHKVYSYSHYNYFIDEDLGFLYLKFEYNDALAVSVPVKVTAVIMPKDPNIKVPYIIFYGASEYFPTDYDLTTPKNLSEEIRKVREDILTSVVTLGCESTRCEGSKILKFNRPGDLDIGIMKGNNELIKKYAIYVSPLETYTQIKFTYIVTGLTLITIGTPLMSSVIIELMRLNSKEEKVKKKKK